MKKAGIKVSILIPSLAVLVAGVLLMCVLIGFVSTQRTNDLSERLVSARVNEYTNEFKAITVESYGVMASLAPMVHRNAVGGGGTGDRTAVEGMLSDVLLSNSSMAAVWTCWEPNAFDGNDSEHTGGENTDESGRFLTTVYRDGDSFGTETLTDYEDPVNGEYYQGALATGEPYITDPYAYELGGRQTQLYTVSFPLKENGKVVGVVGADISLDDLNSVFNAGTIMDDGYLFVLSPSGLVASHPSGDALLQDYRSTWLADEASGIQEVLNGGPAYLTTAASDNGSVLLEVSGVTVGDTGRRWAVCGLVPMANVTATATALVATVAAIGLGLILVTGLVIFFVVRRRLAALPALTATAEALAVGDIQSHGLDESETDTAPTKNEIELLNRAFGKMAQGIRQQAEVMGKIAEGDYSVEVDVRSDADVMNKAMDLMLQNTNRTLCEIQEVASQVAVGSSQIADGATSLATGSTQQAATIQQFGATIAGVQAQAEQSAQMAESTLRDIDRAGGLMDQSLDCVAQMTSAMSTIDESSQHISKVIKTIDDIAFQTNILALNAAVEAARAGTHGKGFAVVADEVRNLANKSAAAAKETAALIQTSLDNVAAGTGIAAKTSASLHEVGEIAQKNAGDVRQLSEMSTQQSTSITELNLGIEQISIVVQANSATAEQSAAASEEMSAQSSMLNKVVAQFQLGGQSNVLPFPAEAEEPALPPIMTGTDGGQVIF